MMWQGAVRNITMSSMRFVYIDWTSLNGEGSQSLRRDHLSAKRFTHVSMQNFYMIARSLARSYTDLVEYVIYNGDICTVKC